MFKLRTYLHLVLPLALLLAAPLPAAHAAGCTDNWSEMAAMVQANGLTPVKDLQRLAKGRIDGKLIKVSLCETGGAYQYELVFLNAGGQVVTQPVDAKTPFPQ